MMRHMTSWATCPSTEVRESYGLVHVGAQCLCAASTVTLSNLQPTFDPHGATARSDCVQCTCTTLKGSTLLSPRADCESCALCCLALPPQTLRWSACVLLSLLAAVRAA
jgi:hypothetical protein